MLWISDTWHIHATSSIHLQFSKKSTISTPMSFLSIRTPGNVFNAIDFMHTILVTFLQLPPRPTHFQKIKRLLHAESSFISHSTVSATPSLASHVSYSSLFFFFGCARLTLYVPCRRSLIYFLDRTFLTMCIIYTSCLKNKYMARPLPP